MLLTINPLTITLSIVSLLTALAALFTVDTARLSNHPSYFNPQR